MALGKGEPAQTIPKVPKGKGFVTVMNGCTQSLNGDHQVSLDSVTRPLC